MPSGKEDDLKSFQIGLMSGAATSSKKSVGTEALQVSKDDYPSLAALSRSKATFKKKTGEKVDSLKRILNSKEETSEEKERAEKAMKAWANALEVVSQLSTKE